MLNGSESHRRGVVKVLSKKNSSEQKWALFFIFVTAFLIVPPSLKARPPQATSDNQPSDFFRLLTGEWKGMAVKTPVGSLEYNIDFAITDDNQLYGVADTGASSHHWRFFQDEGKLQLKFLSTFRGNSTPVLLVQNKSDNNQFVFQHKNPKYLQVWINFSNQLVTIKIILREQPHVRIELTKNE
ncbi:hypothetical protein [Aliikangiella coralliicola]|uniref:DUF1579 domain-containing protein n=1 Tax=Aliikangiella coralliicola TaxID=2592383 RepID=A0A545TWF4_9GAMM|nr:hypothetical protein [Aliikangiella coralliicola]TQV81532.1 hypothetical protein FLL46_25625 [Aliikangiella coralliicola]